MKVERFVYIVIYIYNWILIKNILLQNLVTNIKYQNNWLYKLIIFNILNIALHWYLIAAHTHV